MSDNKLHPKQAPSSDDSAKLDRKIIQDSGRQQARLISHVISHATLGLIIASTFFNILGIGLLYFGKVPEGTITATSGLTTNIVSLLVMLAKENNDRLDRLAKEFKDDD
ncbi:MULTISPECIES: TRADD-N-associated membrane domain-containing protein [unclassified Microcoleus]|uniref:TRADD-N-associated membrane domain-containing protein n=1 Tax=unclassified Microcoleus TaxID=2642155 RepID=UPI002FD01B20